MNATALTLTTFLLLTSQAFAQSGQRIADDGAWCWFADPRAIVVGEELVCGWVDSSGNIDISNQAPGQLPHVSRLHAALHKDDHSNPALLALPDGRVMAFYSRHSGEQMLMRETLVPGKFEEWSEERTLQLNDAEAAQKQGDLTTYTYPNPVYLAKDHTIAMTWRGMNWKPTISFSKDLGKTWSTGKILLSEEGGRAHNRPYVKVVSDGQNRMHFLFTDGHPRNEATNSVYHFYLESDAFFRMDGTQIATLETLPVRPADCDVIYDGKAEQVRAWVWDLALDESGFPVATYTRLPQEDMHTYRYARWNGKRWIDRHITAAGGWFPQTPEGKSEREPHYSGGAVLDPQNPNHVVLSRPINGVFQIEHWITQDHGDHWSARQLTHNNEDSVRPFVARGFVEGQSKALWMNNKMYRHYQDFQTQIESAALTTELYSAALSTEAIQRVALDVGRWQIKTGPGKAIVDWPVAPFLVGLNAATRAGIADFKPTVMQYAESADWLLGPRKLMADDHAVGQAYLELYLLDQDEQMLDACQNLGDVMLTLPFEESLLWEKGIHNREWAWCDALFMAPPMLALLAEATKDERYLNLMDRLWWKTTDYLYSTEHQLFFRDSRFFDQKEANEKPVFWSRGNGWVIAGLARVLQHMPADYPSRPRYVALFQTMAAKLKSIQREDGYWSGSLLDPITYPLPETSGTSFFCYAIAYGINESLLPREEYLPTLEKGWGAMVRAVDFSGRLGWVQPISDRPKKIKASDTNVYASGAFLLTASELMRLVSD